MWTSLVLLTVEIVSSDLLLSIITVISLVPFTTLFLPSGSTSLLRRRLVYNFVLHFGLRTSQVYISTVHIGFLYIQYQMLRHCFILKCYKTKSATRVSIRIFNNLDFLDLPELHKEISKILLTQVIV